MILSVEETDEKDFLIEFSDLTVISFENSCETFCENRTHEPVDLVRRSVNSVMLRSVMGSIVNIYGLWLLIMPVDMYWVY